MSGLRGWTATQPKSVSLEWTEPRKTSRIRSVLPCSSNAESRQKKPNIYLGCLLGSLSPSFIQTGPDALSIGPRGRFDNLPHHEGVNLWKIHTLPITNQWAYGVVSGYHIDGDKPWLTIHHVGGTCQVALRQTRSVVKVDWLNYALQTGVGTNVSVLNDAELAARLPDMIELCANSRTKVPPGVTKLLSAPFEPDALVQIIRPDSLLVMSARRQHVFEWALKKKTKRALGMFDIPKTPGKRKTAPAVPAPAPGKRRKTESSSSEWSDNDDDDQLIDQALQDDEEAVRHQNQGSTRTIRQGQVRRSAFDVTDGSDFGQGRPATTFRPTALEQQVGHAIAHPDNQGKDAQSVLECAQQARANRFLASLAVLRGAWDIGFHTRGLSVAHFQRLTRAKLLPPSSSAVNMTDFSRRNAIPQPQPIKSYQGLVDALFNLRRFGLKFYNDETMGVLDAAANFVESFGEGSEPDPETTRILSLWVDMKFGKFRGLVVSDGLPAAVRVQAEFTLHDSLLSELLYDQQQSQIAALKALLEKPIGTSTGAQLKKTNSRDQRSTKSGGVPKAVLRNLPKKGSRTLCMKFLTPTGCNGNGTEGQCYDTKRAHFRPESLHPSVREHIQSAYGGLAPEYADL
jgi:hypothetical protein